MEQILSSLRQHTIQQVLAKQDDLFRWRFDEKQAQERPQYLYYSPNFTSTLWTLVLLADLQTPPGLPQITSAIQLVTEHFFAPDHGIFRLPGDSHFPIPCLNGNLLYLHHYFKTTQTVPLEQTIEFFAKYQRFDDGGFQTPKTYPYGSNRSCYGSHTCFWGVTKLLKGISFIPKDERSQQAQELLENCIDFVLQHQVCFSSRQPDRFISRDIERLTLPNFYKSDFLELLWLLAREGVHDSRMTRALDLLQNRRQPNGTWHQDKNQNTIVSIGKKDLSSPFITERADWVLAFYGY